MRRLVLVFGLLASTSGAATGSSAPTSASRTALGDVGVRLDERAPLSGAERRRFAASTAAYARAGLVDGVLRVIRVDPGDPNHRYGSRPQAFASSGTLRFWTRTSPDSELPRGSVFADLRGHLFYFAHELGHLVHAAAPAGQPEFEQLHRASRAGPYHGRSGNPGDFVSAYAAESVDEDFAECFSFLTYGRYRWLWGRELKRVFETRPHLWNKLLHVATMVAAVRGEDDGRWPVLFLEDDEDGDAPALAWVELSRDDAGRVNGFRLPPELAPRGGGGCIGCDDGP